MRFFAELRVCTTNELKCIEFFQNRTGGSEKRKSGIATLPLKSKEGFTEMVATWENSVVCMLNFLDFSLGSHCLKIAEKVSFNITSEASYDYILSGQKLIENAKNVPFWRVFENLKLAVKQCYQTGQF